MKKIIGGALFSVFVVALLVRFRDNLIRCWAAPEKIEAIEKKIEEGDKNQDTLNSLYLEQKARQDTQEKVTTLQIESLKELIQVTAELKKKGR